MKPIVPIAKQEVEVPVHIVVEQNGALDEGDVRVQRVEQPMPRAVMGRLVFPKVHIPRSDSHETIVVQRITAFMRPGCPRNRRADCRNLYEVISAYSCF